MVTARAMEEGSTVILQESSQHTRISLLTVATDATGCLMAMCLFHV